MAFPDTPLDVQVEVQLGGTWVDITGDVYLRDPVTIERGRHDEGSRIDPGRCALTIDNRTGAYSPRNAMGPYYGRIGRNVPVRISAGAAALGPLPTYLELPGAGSGAGTPDTAALDITGDLDVRVDVTVLTAGGPIELISKYEYLTGAQRSWQLTLIEDRPALRWSTDGTAITERTATLPVPASTSGRVAIRAALDVDDGAGRHTVTFWTAATLAGPWAQLGDPITAAGTTSIYAGTAPLVVGDNPGQTQTALSGRAHGAEVRSGIGGTLVASPDFTAQAPGTGVFTDSAGRTWTLYGAALIPQTRHTRLTGEISSWPTRRDVSGTDAWIPTEAAGIKRRLGQGADPLASPLRRSLGASGAVAYWPLEDARGSTQAYSPLPGVQPLRATGLEFAADDGPTGSLPLPRVTENATLVGPIPASAALAGGWRIEMVYYLPALAAPSSFPDLLRIASTGSVTTWTISVDSAYMVVYGTASDGTVVVNKGASPDFAVGAWTRLRLEVSQAGPTVAWSLTWFQIGATDVAAVGFMSDVFTGSIGRPVSIDTQFEAVLGDMQLGHLSVMPAGATDRYAGADNGFDGDRPSQRVARLCAEEGVPASVVGRVEDQVALGPQQPAPLLALLEEAAEVDGGYLTESRDAVALHYRPASLSYNQAPALVLDYGAGEIAPPLEPVDDDQATRNDITVSRRGGSSARATEATGPLSVLPPPGGVGRYSDSPELGLYRDTQLEDIASWRLHVGTWDAARYPVVRVDLAAAPHLLAAASAVDIGDLIRLTGLPLADGPGEVDLLVQGYTETLGAYDWIIEFNCTPAGPWAVAVLDDLVVGRADTNGSTLGAGVSSTATSLSIATAAGPLWTTDPAEYPLDLAIAGERVTVTAMSGTTSPQTATVTRHVNGVVKALPADADVRLWQPAILAL
ncbi:hypothetical protein [Kitasatospora sp. NBC_00458]|uniref:hypothetical protein n=1 Tax=Kitasatospora sp. NBC_00458 TaxID=2903568 RepID=UPI002E171967